MSASFDSIQSSQSKPKIGKRKTAISEIEPYSRKVLRQRKLTPDEKLITQQITRALVSRIQQTTRAVKSKARAVEKETIAFVSKQLGLTFVCISFSFRILSPPELQNGCNDHALAGSQ